MTPAAALAHARTRAPRLAWPLAAHAALLAACTGLVAWLLARFPYDGLYGQDAYAYYDQARDLWLELTGHPPLPGAGGIPADRWPIGYHLHVIAGFLAGPGPEGGRAITLAMTVATPVLVSLLAGAIRPGAPLRPRLVAGLLAGGALALTGTYMRMGLSLMADVPSLFWSLLGTYSLLRAWPPAGDAGGARARGAWAAAAGAALGLAVLVRYGAVLLLGPLALYLLLRHLTLRRQLPAGQAGSSRPIIPIALDVLAFGAALLPEALYLATHAAAPGYSIFLSAWNPANVLGQIMSSADGTATYAHANLVFYMLSPLGDALDFLSPWALLALLLGLGTLVRARQWPVLALLLAWWIGPALFFSGTAYQAHRFVLAYLPVLTILIGLGGAAAVEAGIVALRARTDRPLLQGLLAAVVLLGLGVGAWQDQRGVRDWVATHAGWKADENGVIALARAAAGPAAPAGPRVVSFGVTAALTHYTPWPVEDLYNTDEPALGQFFAAPGPRILVVPESSMATQWAGTPLAARWAWLRTHYMLTRAGTAGPYTVYTVADRP